MRGGGDALRQALHRLLHRRLVEHLAELKHGDGVGAFETVLTDGHHDVGVDARSFAFVPKRLGDRTGGHLPLVSEVFVPESTRVRLGELIALARAEGVQLRGLHERVEVLAKLVLSSLEFLLSVEDVLALAREGKAQAEAVGLAGVDVHHVHEAVEEGVELGNAASDALEDDLGALLVGVEAVDHAVDLVE